MPENTHENITLVGRHFPDANGGPFESAQEARDAGHDTIDPVTGTYVFGAMVDGAFVPLITEKASLVFDAIDRDRAQAQAQAADDKSQS